jgi:biopolymer transport protein ExbB/biopolymer transport protein TolQ
LGTVIGVIEAFHQLGDAQNKGAMGNVMAGIAEALVATAVGLFVALPAVVAYNAIQRKIGEIESNVLSVTKLLVAILKYRTDESHAIPAPAESTRTNGSARGPERIPSHEVERTPARPSERRIPRGNGHDQEPHSSTTADSVS